MSNTNVRYIPEPLIALVDQILRDYRIKKAQEKIEELQQQASVST